MNTLERIHGVPENWTGGHLGEVNRERAAEARHGGRLITSNIAHFAGPAISREMMAKDPADAWTFIDDRQGHGAIARGKGAWRIRAQRAAHIGSFAEFSSPHNPEVKAVILKDAEAMVEWPIYAAGIIHSSRICQLCRHKLIDHADYRKLEGCSGCDDVTQTGGYAPCVTA